jgi:hypothetical protein
MSWLSTLLPSLASLATTNPTLATDLVNSMGGTKKAAANAVAAQLHSLTMGVLANQVNGLKNVGNTVTSILGIPHFADLNISDQVNLLNTAVDAPSLLKMITDVETAIKPDLA